MPNTPSVTINKRFTYRGKDEVWSNKYHFSGTTPDSTATANALAAAIWDAEKPFLDPSVKYVGYLVHEAGNEFAIYNRDFVAEGLTLASGTASPDADPPPGDAAVWVRWPTPDRTSRGKRIYLRKYFHGVAGAGDQVQVAARTALVAYAGKMTDGTLPGGFKICGPQGAVAGPGTVAPYISFRQLKRTGKRPSR